MKRCKYCGWWFEPKTTREKYCDDECRREGRRASWCKSKRKQQAREKAGKVLKVDARKLPVPILPPTKEVRIGEVVSDYEISGMLGDFGGYSDKSEEAIQESRKRGGSTYAYTDEENSIIIRMAEQGATFTTIANELGRTPNAIRIQHGKLIKAGIGKAQ